MSSADKSFLKTILTIATTKNSATPTPTIAMRYIGHPTAMDISRIAVLSIQFTGPGIKI